MISNPTTNIGTTYPKTQVISWIIFNESNQKTSIKDYLLHVLKDYQNGLTRKELALLIEIEQNSLTAPILELVREEKLFVSGVRVNPKSKRFNQVYRFNAQNN